MVRTVSERENSERKGEKGKEGENLEEMVGREVREIKTITPYIKRPDHEGLAGHGKNFSSYSQWKATGRLRAHGFDAMLKKVLSGCSG